MRQMACFALAVIIAVLAITASVSAQTAFPSPSKTLHDVSHKETKSDVQAEGNQAAIQSGVGAPETINTLSFSADSKLLAAGKNFGRIVVWTLPDGKVAHVIDTHQNIVSALAISPDHAVLATAGSEDHPAVIFWNLQNGSLESAFPVQHPPVQELTFSQDGRSLVVRENGAAYVLDVSTGKQAEMPSEHLPVVSLDGTDLLSTNGASFLLRTLAGWRTVKEFAAPSTSAWPMAVDTKQDLYVYADFASKQNFVAVKLSSNQPFQSKPLGLPQFNPSVYFFASVLPDKPIVFGHNDGRLWGWNVATGKTCISPALHSESGRLSPDGQILAGSIDNDPAATKKIQPGVEIWEMPSLLKHCGLEQ
jgi:WD40 repeat protein